MEFVQEDGLNAIHAIERTTQSLFEIREIINRPAIKWYLRFYGVVSEWLHSSLKNKWLIFCRLIRRLLGSNCVVHFNNYYCFYSKIRDNIDQSVAEMPHAVGELKDVYSTRLYKNNQEVFQLIDHAHVYMKKVMCIMAPIFTKERLKDGYFRRIKAVDDIMGDNVLKIYMSPMDCDDMQNGHPRVVRIDDTHIRVDYYPHVDDNRRFINEIAACADGVYHHGVGFMDEDVIRIPHLLKIVDLHGALPEEFAMSDNYPMVQVESYHEELAMRYADFLVCVTERMANHMKAKYPQYNQNYIIMPILDQETLDSGSEDGSHASKNGNTVITYAGGTQKWQMIPQMQECIRKRAEYDYRIYVPHPDLFWKSWGNEPIPEEIVVKSLTPKELRKAYNDCQYGFVLREDTIVNNVACPTKLIEYILKGIVPILNTEKLGDFVDDGMKYVSVKDFCEGNLPTEEEREKIARDNKAVIEKIIEKYLDGRKKIHDIVAKGGNRVE